VIRIADMNGILIRDPDQPTAPGARDRHRAADFNPDVAVNPNDGNLYAVWQDARFSGFIHNDIAFTMSTDGGRTWSAPIKVNQTPASATGHNGHAFTPSVHVLPNGTIGVSYYDFRNNVPGGGTSTDHWLVHCHPGIENCASAGSWDDLGDEVRVTPASFDSRQARSPVGSSWATTPAWTTTARTSPRSSPRVWDRATQPTSSTPRCPSRANPTRGREGGSGLPSLFPWRSAGGRSFSR
jgi:hypothetical protein